MALLQGWLTVPSLCGQAGSADIGWTLGYMLNLTNMIPAEAPVWVKGHVLPLWAAAVAFIILTLALGLAALLLLLWG